MNKALLVLTLLCGFLLGVVAGPWIRPPQQVTTSPADIAPVPQQAAVVPVLPPPPAAPIPAPPPEPELVLKGVLVGTDASRSRALIAHGESDAKPYKLDDKLPNGYVLKAVSSKNVEIEKNGDTVSLTLVRAGASSEPDAIEPEPAASSPDAPIAAEPAPTEPPVPSEDPSTTTGQES